MNLEKKSLSGYLQRKKLLTRGTPIRVMSLGDGLKNRVYYVAAPKESWIVKQAHSRAQIKERWWLDRRRIFAEASCIDVLRQFLPPAITPQIVLEDRTDFVLVTTSPPENASLWENDLNSGRIDLQIAVQCGELLATVHNETAHRPELKSMFKDMKPFGQLCIEPHYNHPLNAFPDLKKVIAVQTKRLVKEASCLVLSDLRPRNVWINNGQVYLVDFAAAHYGHPGFDLAFYAADMCIKAMQNGVQKAAYLEAINVFWNGYFKLADYKGIEDIEKPAVRDLGCLLLSATDGRQPIEFEDPHVADLARRIAMSLLFTELKQIEDITEFINRTLIDG
jgi:5-methylthioribose kinase